MQKAPSVMPQGTAQMLDCFFSFPTSRYWTLSFAPLPPILPSTAEQTMFLCVEDVPCVEDKVVFVLKVTCLLCEWWSEGKCHQWRNKHNG